MTSTVSDDDPGRQQARSPSPPTGRVVRVVELLADTADGTLSLAEIVRLTGLSRATAHAIVTELSVHGWVRRDPADGTFDLGPRFLALARTAIRTDPLADIAGEPLRRLAAERSVGCFLAQLVDDDTITVVDHARPDDTTAPGNADSHPLMTQGRRIRLRPPISREFIAWADADIRAAWLARAPEASRTRLAMVLDAIVERGYSIERLTPEHTAVIDALGALDSVPGPLRTRVSDLLSELTTIDYLPGELIGEVSAVTVGAPIVDDGRVVAAIVSCPNSTMPAADLIDLGAATRAAADTVTAALR